MLFPPSTLHPPPSVVRGMTLIEVVVGSAIMLVVFLGLFGAFQLSIELVFNTKAKSGAVALATERMEYIRSLPYDSVGTVGGIPAGPVPQLEQRSLNGIEYTIRTLVIYEDRPEDGLDTLDENGITADSKIVKAEILWSSRGFPRSTLAVTRVAPRGVETITGGGTLRVNVIDSLGAPMPQASVRIENPDTTPAIDVTSSTNAGGSVIFPGAPSASGYQITVTKAEFSSAETYGATPENPNPNPGHVAIVEGVTSTLSLAIDELASLMVTTLQAPGPGSWSDTFTDATGLSSLSSTVVSGGSLILLDSGAGYPESGNAISNPISPQYLASWDEFSWGTSSPPGSSLTTRLYYFDGSVFSLIPEEDLPGNAAGFSASPVDLSLLPVATYSQLEAGAFLSTADASTTSALLSWELSYIAGPTPLPNVDFDIRGTKTIGSTGTGAPIYKVDESHATTQYGEWLIDPLEADTYVIEALKPGYNLAEQCPFDDVSVSPGSASTLSLTFAPATAHSLLVNIDSGTGPIAGANITLTGPEGRAGATSSCGQIFFKGLIEGTYNVSVTAPGFLTMNEDVAVSGPDVFSTTLPAL